MQKKLIALAIAGLSSAAFAQSTVTISGNFDMGYQNTNTQTAAQGKDTSQTWAGNGSSTSTLGFTGTEALGGGMTAGFQLSTDFTPGAQQVSGVSATTIPAAGNAPFANQLFNSQNYLMLSGNFGTLKLGTINHTSLEAEMGAQPFATAIGSGVSASFARLNGIGDAGNILNNTANATGGARMVRAGNSMKYDTPSFSGFQGTYNHVFKNDNDQYSSVGMQELGLKYNNGPANVWYTNTKIDSGSNQIGVGINAAAITSSVTKHNILSGNYTFGPATVYAGWTSSKQDLPAGNTVDARSWNIALKYAMGNFAFMANVLKVDDKRITDVDRNLNALGLDYSMSKRTTAYVRYETGDNDRGSPTGNNTGAFTRWAAGMRHSF